MVLITGGAGYIGSHTVQLLKKQTDKIIVLDDLSTGFKESVPSDIELVVGSTLDLSKLEELFSTHKIKSVVHFAARLIVPESVSNPLKYYNDNIQGTLNLLKMCEKYNVKRFIFSSTAAVYGVPKTALVSEASDKQPINPYGFTKLVAENMIQDFSRTQKDFSYVILRYFNVAGGAVDCSNGQRTKDATHLIKVASQAATGKRSNVNVFGTDFNTIDGTGVRDYIHVTDLAQAHLDALNYLSAGGKSDIFNCGYGIGYSVKQVLDTVKKVSDVDFEVILAGRREGDPDELVADNTKILNTLKWTPRYNDIELICKTAYEWEKNLK